jgi:hypothetical protein
MKEHGKEMQKDSIKEDIRKQGANENDKDKTT